MPVKLRDIPSVMIEQNYKICSCESVCSHGSMNKQYQRGHKEALSLQSEVCIGLNRELLIFQLMEFALSNDLSSEPFAKLADFLIAQEHTLLEKKT